jgi:hypothetical protein
MRKYFIALLLPALLGLTLGLHSPQHSQELRSLPLRSGLSRSDRITANINETDLARALVIYSELTGRTQAGPLSQQLDEFFGGYLSRWHLIKPATRVSSSIEYHRDGLFTVGELKDHLETLFSASGLVLIPEGQRHFRAIIKTSPQSLPSTPPPSALPARVSCNTAASAQQHFQLVE